MSAAGSGHVGGPVRAKLALRGSPNRPGVPLWT